MTLQINKKPNNSVEIVKDGVSTIYSADFIARVDGESVVILARHPNLTAVPLRAHYSAVIVEGTPYPDAEDAVVALNAFIGNFKRGGSAPSPTTTDLTYHIEGATPDTVVRTYSPGTRVILLTPDQLGMSLPTDYHFAGWRIDGKIVTELVMGGDTTAEGDIGRATIFQGSQFETSVWSVNAQYSLIKNFEDGLTACLIGTAASSSLLSYTVRPQFQIGVTYCLSFKMRRTDYSRGGTVTVPIIPPFINDTPIKLYRNGELRIDNPSAGSVGIPAPENEGEDYFYEYVITPRATAGTTRLTIFQAQLANTASTPIAIWRPKLEVGDRATPLVLGDSNNNLLRATPKLTELLMIPEQIEAEQTERIALLAYSAITGNTALSEDERSKIMSYLRQGGNI